MAWALECDVCAHTCLKRDSLEKNLEKDSIVECSRTARYTTNTVQFGRRLGGRRARALPYPEGMAPEPYLHTYGTDRPYDASTHLNSETIEYNP